MKRSVKYNNATYIKDCNIHGPIWDAFEDPYVVVYGTVGSNTSFVKTCKDMAYKLADDAPCFADVDIPKKLISDHNLILVGSVESNSWIARISEYLPVTAGEGRIFTTNGMVFDGKDLGYIVIYPNPINAEKYVVVYSATSEKAMANIFKAYSKIKSIRPIDVGIFEIPDTNNIKWHVMEQLNTVWDWHVGWDHILITTKNKHPKWQWRQWIAKVVRTQLEVDVVICEDPFMFGDSVPSGQITYRDLFNAFKNVWFTKVRIDGKSLRSLLTVPFANISKRDVDAPIIDGVSLLQEPSGTEKHVLTINEIEDDPVYIAAMPEKCLNGKRLGMVLENYDIIDQVYLIPILKQYIESNSEINIDDQLNSLTLKLY